MIVDTWSKDGVTLFRPELYTPFALMRDLALSFMAFQRVELAFVVSGCPCNRTCGSCTAKLR